MLLILVTDAISTCTAVRAFSLPPPNVSDSNEELSTDVVIDDDVPSQHLEGASTIIADATISTCTAGRAFTLLPPHISDGNVDLFTDVVNDDVPSQSYLTSNNIDFCISEGHTRSGKLFYGEPSRTVVTTQSMCTSTPKGAKTRGGRRGQGGLCTRGSAKRSILIRSGPAHNKSATSNYTDFCRDHRRFPFSGKSKVCCNPTDPSSPLSVLKTFLTDELMDNITAHTNNYAEFLLHDPHIIERIKGMKRSIFQLWKHTNRDEIWL